MQPGGDVIIHEDVVLAPKVPKCTLKYFDNQITLVASLVMDDTTAPANTINIKVFRNGGVQMTGLRRTEQAADVTRAIANALALRCPCVLGDPGALSPGGERICMINAHLRLGFGVNRTRLLQSVRERYPGTTCVFEPCIYPGVKVHFMHNVAPPSTSHGACGCTGVGPCSGRGTGQGDGTGCRKVSMLIFQSGSVLITGAQSVDQVQSAYHFLTAHIAADDRIRTLAPPA